MGNSTFNRDLDTGVSVEMYILNSIKEKYPDAFKMEGYYKEYDIYVPSIDMKIEVKQDYKSHYTGNFVIEIEFNGKPSALITTKANYWVFASREYIYWITVDSIWAMLIENKHLDPVVFVGKGDTSPKRAYLVPVDLVSRYSDMITPNELPYVSQSPS